MKFAGLCEDPTTKPTGKLECPDDITDMPRVLPSAALAGLMAIFLVQCCITEYA